MTEQVPSHIMVIDKKIAVETPTCLECFSTDVELKYLPVVEDIDVMWYCPVAVCLQCGEESDQPEAGQFLDELYASLDRSEQ